MAKYTEAWRILRDQKSLEISAPQAWHHRIFTGIRKERYRDLLHALYLADNHLFDRVYFVSHGNTMKWTLVRKSTLPPTAEDLFGDSNGN